MIKIDTYPYGFELSGEQWELHENMVRWVRVSGEENKMSLTGNVVGAAVFEDADDAVVVVEYPHNEVFHTMGKQTGWKGPFKELKDVVHRNGRVVVLDAEGEHAL